MTARCDSRTDVQLIVCVVCALVSSGTSGLRSCWSQEQLSPIRFSLVDVDVPFVHDDGSCGQYHIVEAMSSGLALFDFDGDGDVDIYCLNGRPQATADAARQPRNALLRNDGNWRFTDVTEAAGVGDMHHSLGVCVGDYDNDGQPDLYVNNFGPNTLYRNRGDGTFEDVTQSGRGGQR